MDPTVQFVGDIKPPQDTQLFRVRLRPMPSRLSLTGTLGLQSNWLADLPLGSSRFWSIGPTLSWPSFGAARMRATIQGKMRTKSSA